MWCATALYGSRVHSISRTGGLLKSGERTGTAKSIIAAFTHGKDRGREEDFAYANLESRFVQQQQHNRGTQNSLHHRFIVWGLNADYVIWSNPTALPQHINNSYYISMVFQPAKAISQLL